jgi:hypothetical protein
MMRKGLELGGFERDRQRNVRRVQNLERFKTLYGSNPVVYSEIFEDLYTMQIAEARIDGCQNALRRFISDDGYEFP